MRIKTTILMLVILSLITLPVVASDLYIGNFAPEKEINIDFIINIVVDETYNDDFVFNFESDYFISDNNSIPISRISMLLKDGRKEVSLQELFIKKEQLMNDVTGYLIPLTLKLKPLDKPGLYQNNLIIKTLYNDIIFNKDLIFRVDRWAVFELAEQKYMQIMFSDLNNSIMKSSMPVILKVASNVDWELYGFLNEQGEEMFDKLNLYIRKKEDEDLIKSDAIKINSSPKLVTTGKATVNQDSYWINLDIFMEIEEITKINSGFKEFPVIFYLNSIN